MVHGKYLKMYLTKVKETGNMEWKQKHWRRQFGHLDRSDNQLTPNRETEKPKYKRLKFNNNGQGQCKSLLPASQKDQKTRKETYLTVGG